ncbi:MAG TPA: hypothetical protein VKB78_09385 [Pirellulales bacterium]|nr:hypothetical protein [Pirellulales bacterium]
MVQAYHHNSGRLRIDHYLGYAELPFVALRVTTPNGQMELIGRFATLAKAQAACLRHMPTKGAVTNSLGDPITPC